MKPIDRRRMVGALASAPLIASAAWTLFPLPTKAATVEPFRSRRVLMGTSLDITVADPSQPGLASACEAAWAEMSRLAGLMSRFDAASELSALNRAAGEPPVKVSPDLMRVLREAERVTAFSDGAFDITVGRLTPGPGSVSAAGVPDDDAVRKAVRHVGRSCLRLDARDGTACITDEQTLLDLGGIAKLPILQAGLNVFAQHGIRGAMLNGGGDVLASARADGKAWRIGVRDPVRPDRLLGVMALPAGVVASSGDYERFVLHRGARYHHVIDPSTGRPTRGVAGVTLVARDVSGINGLGAATMVAGAQRGPALLRRAGVAEALIVRDDGRVWLTPAMARRLPVDPARQLA